MIPGFEEIVQTVHGNLPVVKKPKWLKFTAFGAGAQIHIPGMEARHDENGMAGGFLDTEVAARRIKESESDIIDFLENHEAFGNEFTSSTAQGNGSELTSNEEFIVPEGDGGFYCKLCEQSMSSIQGLNGHKSSKKHRIHEEAFYDALRDRLKHHTQ